MARPRKEGMDYFPHDTDARNDMKIRKLRAVHGNDGYATYFILLENIYRDKEYKIDISDAETKLILAEECKLSKEKFIEIVLKCIDLGLFSKKDYEEQKILTSEAIKKRTEPIENKRKKNNKAYSNKKDEVSDAETMAESTQSKEKKSIVKHSKENIYIEQTEMLWSLYPSKTGKATAIKKIPKLIKQYSYEQMERCIERYKQYVTNRQNTDFPTLKYQNGSTFFNSGYMDYLDENYKPLKQVQEQRANAAAYQEWKRR